MLNTSAEFDSLKFLPGKPIIIARLKYGDETAYTSLSNSPLNIGSEKFFNVIDGFPKTVQSLNMYTHQWTIPGITLKLVNHGDPGQRWTDLISTAGAGNDIGYYNREVTVKLYLGGMTSWASGLTIFTGIVRDIKHSRTSTTIKCESSDEILIRQKIPDLITDSDAADPGLGLPAESLGRSKVLVYGGHISNRGGDSKASDATSAINDFSPCAYLGVDASDKQRWLVADHEIFQINTNGDDSEQQQIWGFDSTLRRMVRLKTSFTVEQNTAAGCIISLANDPEFWDHWYPNGQQDAQNSGDPQITDFDTPANIIDKDFSTFATAQMTGVTDQNEWVEVEILFPPYDNQSISSTDITQLDVMIYMKTRLTGVTDIDYVVEAKGTTPTTAFTDPSGGSYPDTRLAATMSGSDNLQDIHDPIRIRLTMNNAPVGPGEDIFLDVYQVYKRIQYKRRELMPLYFGGRGHEYGAWVNDRSTDENDPKRSGNFSETHNNDDGQGGHLRNFAGGVESILRDELAQVTVNIDENYFNIASNDVTDYALSGSVFEEQPVGEILREMLSNCQSYLWSQPDATWKMKTIEHEYSSSDLPIPYEDFSGFKYDRTPLSDITTYATVRYNYSAGRYLSETSPQEGAGPRLFYNLTAAQSTLNFEARWLGDDTSADSLALWLLGQWQHVHTTLEGSLDKSYANLDIGDIIEISGSPPKAFGETITANVTRSGDTIYKYWWIYHIERGERIRIKAFQLHKTN